MLVESDGSVGCGHGNRRGNGDGSGEGRRRTADPHGIGRGGQRNLHGRRDLRTGERELLRAGGVDRIAGERGVLAQGLRVAALRRDGREVDGQGATGVGSQLCAGGAGAAGGRRDFREVRRITERRKRQRLIADVRVGGGLRAVAAGPADGGIVESQRLWVGQIDLVDICVVGIDDIEVACAVQGHSLLLIQLGGWNQSALGIAAVGLQGQLGDDSHSVVGDIDVSVAIHRDATRIAPAAAQLALRVARTGELQFENRAAASVFSVVGDIDISTGINRDAPGVGQSADNRLLRVGAIRRRQFNHAVAAIIGDIHISPAVHGHTAGILPPSAERSLGVGSIRLQGEENHGRIATIPANIGDIEVACAIHGDGFRIAEGKAIARDHGRGGIHAARQRHLIDCIIFRICNVEIPTAIDGHPLRLREGVRTVERCRKRSRQECALRPVAGSGEISGCDHVGGRIVAR